MLKKLVSSILVIFMLLSLAACQPPATQEDPETNPSEKPSIDVERDADGGVDVEALVSGMGLEYYSGEVYDDPDAADLTGKKIAIVLPNAGNTWTSAVFKAVTEFAEECEQKYGIITSINIARDVEDQINIIQNLIAQGDLDGMTIFPVSGNDIQSAAQAAIDAGISVLVYGRPIDQESWGRTQFTGDGYMMGYSIANYLNIKYKDELDAGEKITAINLIGDGGYTGQERSNSFLELLDDRFTVVDFVTNWSREDTMAFMESIFNSYSEEDLQSIRAIYSTDDDLTRGVLTAIDNYIGDTELKIDTVTGVECMPDVIYRAEELASRGIELVEMTYPPYTAKYALQMLLNIMQGQTYDPILYRMPLEIVNHENIDEYRASEEFQDLCYLYDFDYENGTYRS